MALSDTACKNAHKHQKTSANKPFKLGDSKGLYLLVKPQADGWGKWWRFKYRFGVMKSYYLWALTPTPACNKPEKSETPPESKLPKVSTPANTEKVSLFGQV